MTTLPILRIAVLFGALLHAGGSTFSKERVSETETNLNSDQQLIATVVDSAPKFAPFGFKAITLSDLEGNLAQWARKKLDLSDRLQVVSVDENSPASDAGLKMGDVIISINNEYVTKGKAGVAFLRTHITPEINWSHPVELIVIRDGSTIQLEIPKQKGSAS